MSHAKNVVPNKELNARIFYTYVCLFFTWIVLFAMLSATGAGLGPIIFFEFLIIFLQYWYSDRITMFGLGATQVEASEAPELHAMVDKLCILADMPKPKVAIADQDYLNACASGRNSNNSVIIVTRGLQSTITDEELYAVLAHEVAHIANRDVAIMTFASTVLVLAGLLAQASFWNSISIRRGSDKNSSKGTSFLFAIFIYIVSFLLIKALSRCRELAADRTSAFLIQDAKPLASALVKIDGALSSTPVKDLRSAEAFSSLMVSPALGHGKRDSRSNWFSTHPTLEERLIQLDEISEILKSNRRVS